MLSRMDKFNSAEDTMDLARALVVHGSAAIAEMRAGRKYFYKEDIWAVATERKSNVLTGRIIVLCTDPEALAKFFDEAKRLGDTVKYHDGITVLLTPKPVVAR